MKRPARLGASIRLTNPKAERGGDLMGKQGLKKVCPLLAIAQAASGQNVQNLAPCIGERCAFCIRAHVYGDEYTEYCAIVGIACGLDAIAHE